MSIYIFLPLTFPSYSLQTRSSSMGYLHGIILFFPPFSTLSNFLHVLQLAKKLHPDTNKDDPEAEKKFQEVSIAYEVYPCCNFCYYIEVYFKSLHDLWTDCRSWPFPYSLLHCRFWRMRKSVNSMIRSHIFPDIFFWFCWIFYCCYYIDIKYKL